MSDHASQSTSKSGFVNMPHRVLTKDVPNLQLLLHDARADIALLIPQNIEWPVGASEWPMDFMFTKLLSKFIGSTKSEKRSGALQTFQVCFDWLTIIYITMIGDCLKAIVDQNNF